MRPLYQRLLELVRASKLGGVLARHAERGETRGYALGSAATSTGETVYGDRPLRFRNLTLTEADVPLLEDPTATQIGFKIRISRMRRGRREAGTLVEKQYGARGYQIPGRGKEPELYTFIAYDEGLAVGTVSVRLDSKRRGLGADDLYGPELNSLREQGFRLCEFTRLAVDRLSASKPVLAGLFHTAYLYASVIRGSTHAVIEVNPRHTRFYQRALGFQVIGETRMNRRVNAPAVLLYVSFDYIAEGLAKYAGNLDAVDVGGSVFPYCFPADEEIGVLNRLRDLVKSQ